MVMPSCTPCTGQAGGGSPTVHTDTPGVPGHSRERLRGRAERPAWRGPGGTAFHMGYDSHFQESQVVVEMYLMQPHHPGIRRRRVMFPISLHLPRFSQVSLHSRLMTVSLLPSQLLFHLFSPLLSAVISLMHSHITSVHPASLQ